MFRLGACLSLALLMALTGCRGSTGNRWSLAVKEEELAQADLTYYWQNTIELAEGEEIRRIWQQDENVYCISDANAVYVFDATVGRLKWSRELADPRKQLFGPSHVDRVALPASVGVNTVVTPDPEAKLTVYDAVIFNTPSHALVLDRSTGKLLQKIAFSRAGFSVNTACASDGVRLFAGTIRGRYCAMSIVSGLMEWQRSTNAMVSATPLYLRKNRNLYLASQDGTIYATRADEGAEDGEKIWPVPQVPQARSAFLGNIATDAQGRVLFAGNMDYSVYAIEPLGGKVLWRYRCPGPIKQPVQVGKTSVYARVDGGSLYAIPLAAGDRERWIADSGRMILAEIGGNVLVLNDRNEMLVTDAAIGKVHTVVAMTGLDLFASGTDPVVYAGSRKGLIACLKPRAAGYVTPAMVPARP